MKVTRIDTHEFELIAETEADDHLICALDVYGTHLRVCDTIKTDREDQPGQKVTGVTLSTDPNSRVALERAAGREVVSAIRQLGSLLSRQPADHCHICALTADPQTHE